MDRQSILAWIAAAQILSVIVLSSCGAFSTRSSEDSRPNSGDEFLPADPATPTSEYAYLDGTPIPQAAVIGVVEGIEPSDFDYPLSTEAEAERHLLAMLSRHIDGFQWTNAVTRRINRYTLQGLDSIPVVTAVETADPAREYAGHFNEGIWITAFDVSGSVDVARFLAVVGIGHENSANASPTIIRSAYVQLHDDGAIAGFGVIATEHPEFGLEQHLLWGPEDLAALQSLPFP